MGKFSGSLEKSGHEIGLEELTETKAAERPAPKETRPVSEPPPPPPLPPRTTTRPSPVTPAVSQPSLLEPRRKNDGLRGVWDERLFKAVNDDIYIPEMFKIIRSRIINPKEGTTAPQTIMITSVVPKEGKSFITANLGISLARGLDQHCLLVDCDLRRPSLAGLFGIKQAQGLADYLRDGVALEDLIVKTEVNTLSILPSGTPPVNPAELLSSVRMHALINELSARYDDRIILFDSPPMLIAAEASILASHVDTVIMVVRQGKASKSQVQQFIESVGPQRILGVVFNDYAVTFLEKTLVKGYGYYQSGYS